MPGSGRNVMFCQSKKLWELETGEESVKLTLAERGRWGILCGSSEDSVLRKQHTVHETTQERRQTTSEMS